MERYKWKVLVEPSIRTSSGLFKPDLVMSRSGAVYVVDATIVADNAVLNREHRLKIEKYDTPEVRQGVAALIGEGTDSDDVQVSAVALNYRGALASKSLETLQSSFAWTKREAEILSVIILEIGYKCYVGSARTTARQSKGFGGPHRAGRR